MTQRLAQRDYQVLFRRLTPTEAEKKFFITVPDSAISVRPPIALQFTCEKGLGKEPNKLELKLYNLAPATRAELQREKIVCRFAAGYDGVSRRMFVGDVSYSNTEKKGTEYVTEIHVKDGGRAYAQARANKSFKAGTKYIDVIRYVVSSMGLFVPKAIENNPAFKVPFLTGYAMSGKSQQEMESLLAPFGYSFSIQNGVMQILKDDESNANAVREISQATGMIGSPEFGKPEAKGKPPKRTVNSMLYPELQPGGRVNIISRQLEGVHKIEKLKHTGDTESDDWKTQVEVEPTK